METPVETVSIDILGSGELGTVDIVAAAISTKASSPTLAPSHQNIQSRESRIYIVRHSYTLGCSEMLLWVYAHH